MALAVLQALCLCCWLVTGTATTPVPVAAPVWQSPQGAVWGSFECPSMGNFTKHTPDECKQACLATQGCTAINYLPPGIQGVDYVGSPWNCDLRRCPRIPKTGLVPPPLRVHMGWEGYALQDYKNSVLGRGIMEKVVEPINKTAREGVQKIEGFFGKVGAFLHPTPSPASTTLPLPAGWSSAVDAQSGNLYYWMQSDPQGTETWVRPIPTIDQAGAVGAKFKDQVQPESALATRHQPWIPAWFANTLWLSMPLLLAGVVVYRKKLRSSKVLFDREDEPEVEDARRHGEGEQLLTTE